MVINIRLSERQTADSDDPLGRDWYGYDPEATPEQLWANNRGDWFLDETRIASQRWAALNYQGQIVLVAELGDPYHEIVTGTGTGRSKKALIGRVLADGHPIHNVLMGTQIEYPPGSRNSILYRADPETDGLVDAGPPEEDLHGTGDQRLQMALSELTEASAVARAVEEFRTRGRDAFLERYGHRPSVRYFAEVDGMLIDSKPLLSVAYGYQYPASGPLAVRHFSGGEETRRTLKRFGYQLVELQAGAPGVVYGEVPDCPPGTVFKDRREAYDAGVHRTTQAGIAGQADGTQSICLSDGYSDDEIQGDLITYTGFGGRDANTGRHIADQKLEKGNLGLVEDYKLGRPVRVLVKESVLSGRKSDTEYVYLGLFIVASWSWGTRDGWKVLIYQLRAVAGDSLIPGDVAGSLTRGEDVPPQRRSANVSRIVRNYEVAVSVKRLYDNTCQICGTKLVTAAGPYSEGAHIRPLGVPHNGPDTLDNVLCLCPNCHVLFDGHALTVRPDGTVLKMGEPAGKLRIAPDHHLNFGHLAYQQQISTGVSEPGS